MIARVGAVAMAGNAASGVVKSRWPALPADLIRPSKTDSWIVEPGEIVAGKKIADLSLIHPLRCRRGAPSRRGGAPQKGG